MGECLVGAFGAALTERAEGVLVAGVLVDELGARGERLLDGGHRVQFLVVDLDELGRIERLLAGLRDDDRDGLPPVAHFLQCEDLVVRAVMTEVREQAVEIRAGDHEPHTGHRQRVFGVNCGDVGVRAVGTDNHPVQRVRPGSVCHVLGAATHLRLDVQPRDVATDHAMLGAELRPAHAVTSGVLVPCWIFRAAASTAVRICS